MKLFNILGATAVALTATFATSASAVTFTPVVADCDPNFPGTSPAPVCSMNPTRTDATAVNFGAADGNFYSLGLDGFLILVVTPAFTGPALVVEVTNTPSNHFEAAIVFAGLAGDDGLFDASTFVDFGTLTNGRAGQEAAVNSVEIAGVWDFIGFLDVSLFTYPDSGSTDGFDIDAITVSVAAVPLPASVLMLLAAMGGLGIAGRRRAA